MIIKVLRYVFLLTLLVIGGCKEKINNSIIPPEVLPQIFKVEGVVYSNNIPIINIEVFLDTLKTISDSSGYFIFDSLKSQNYRLHILLPQYLPVDTFLNINKDYYLSLHLTYRSNSFFPLAVGNKWIYNDLWVNWPDSNDINLVKEVIGREQIGNKNFFKLLNTSYSENFVDTSRTVEYWLLEGDSLYIYTCNHVSLLTLFNISERDTFIYKGCYGSHYGNLIQDNGEELKYYYQSTSGALDAWFYLYFKKGIGITKIQSAWSHVILMDYEIKY